MISLICGILNKGHKRTLQKRKRLTHFEKCMVTKEGSCGEEGWTGGLGLAYAHWGIWNDWPTGPALEHREFYPVFFDSLRGKRTWKRMDMCICTTGSLCCTAEMINLVNQLYINKAFYKKGTGNSNTKFIYWVSPTLLSLFKMLYLHEPFQTQLISTTKQGQYRYYLRDSG